MTYPTFGHNTGLDNRKESRYFIKWVDTLSGKEGHGEPMSIDAVIPIVLASNIRWPTIIHRAVKVDEFDWEALYVDKETGFIDDYQ